MLMGNGCLCGLWTWRKLLQSTEESSGMGNEEESNTSSFG